MAAGRAQGVLGAPSRAVVRGGERVGERARERERHAQTLAQQGESTRVLMRPGQQLSAVAEVLSPLAVVRTRWLGVGAGGGLCVAPHAPPRVSRRREAVALARVGRLTQRHNWSSHCAATAARIRRAPRPLPAATGGCIVTAATARGTVAGGGRGYLGLSLSFHAPQGAAPTVCGRRGARRTCPPRTKPRPEAPQDAGSRRVPRRRTPVLRARCEGLPGATAPLVPICGHDQFCYSRLRASDRK